MDFKSSTTLGIALILTVFGLPTVAWAQATATGDLSAEVQEIPISLTQNTPLSFGTFMPFGRPGQVLVGGDTSFSSTNVYIVAPGERASWMVTGVPNAFFNVVYNTSGTVTNGSDTMEVTLHGLYAFSGRIAGNGEEEYNLGATVSVNANQPPGTYTGTYEMTVVYNTAVQNSGGGNHRYRGM